jgi:hypothetical protein
LAFYDRANAVMEDAMTAFINYHPRPSPYAGARALYAAIVGMVLILMAVAVAVI